MLYRTLAFFPIVLLIFNSGCGSSQSTISRIYNLFGDEAVQIEKLGPEINRLGQNYAPNINPSGTVLYYVNASDGSSSESDLYIALKTSPKALEFDAAAIPAKTLNSDYAEGCITFTEDGNEAVYVACHKPGGMGDCDLYEVSNAQREKPTINLIREVSTSKWETNPALSSDGKTLYFVSNRDSQHPDIYVSHKDHGKRWEEPIRLKAPVNSGDKEDSPFLAFADTALFFSSNRSGGYGGYDLYVSFLQADGKWGEPYNLGPTINSSADDRYITLTSDGSIVYFASNRDGGQFNIYMMQGNVEKKVRSW